MTAIAEAGLSPMPDYTIVTAGAMVLLGIACLAEDCVCAANAAESDQNPSAEYLAATTVNGGTDLALVTLGSVLIRSEEYLKIAAQLTGTPDPNSLKGIMPKSGGPLTVTLAFVELFKTMAGYELPYQGDSFEKGSEKYIELLYQLADVTYSLQFWDGESARLCRYELDGLVDEVTKLVDFDKNLARSARRQADIVVHIRLALGVLEALLLLAHLIHYWYDATLNQTKAWEFATQAAAWGMFALAGILSAFAAGFSAEQENHARKMAFHYRHMATRLRGYPALHESVQAEVVAAPDMWIIDFESMLTRLPTLPAPQAKSVPVAERTPAASVLSAPAVAAPERETGKKLGHAVPWSDMPAQRFSAKEAAPAKAVPFAPATDPDEDGAADAGTPTTGERAPVDLTGAVDPRRGDSPWQISRSYCRIYWRQQKS